MNSLNKLFFDVETYKHIEKSGQIVNKIYLIGLCDENDNFNYFTTVKDFIVYLFNSFNNIVLYGFNVAYDLSALIYDCGLGFDDYSLSFGNLVHNDEKQFIYGSFQITKWYKGKPKSKKITVKDLWIFDKTKSVSKYYSILFPNKEQSKGIIDYDKYNLYIKDNLIHYKNEDGTKRSTNLEHELDYLKRDVLILPKILEFQNNFKLISNNLLFDTVKKSIFNRQTIGSVIKFLTDRHLRENCKYKMGFEIFRHPIDFFEKSVMNRSFLGGFVFTNSEYSEYYGDVWKIDVNSLYPSIETLFPLPIGPLNHISTINYCITKDIVIWYKIRFKHIKYIEKYKWISTLPIPLHLSGMDFYISKDYFDAIKDIVEFKDLVILDEYFQNTTTRIADIHKKLYSIKISAIDNTHRNIAKLLINSSYGKKAEKQHETNMIYYYDKNLGNYILKDHHILTTCVKSIFTGIYVAQMARVYFLKHIKKLTELGVRIFYGDTDCVFIDKDPRLLPIEIDNNKMGSWKIENPVINNEYVPYKGFLTLQNKLKKYYAWCDDLNFTLSFSGIPVNYIYALSHEDRLKLFSDNNNVIVRNSKKISKNNVYGQSLIYTTDFETNSIDKNGKPIKPNYELIDYKLLPLSYVRY